MELTQAELYEKLKKTVELIKEQDAQIKRISEAPLQVGTVGFVTEDFIYVGAQGSLIRLLNPKEIKLQEGDPVLLHPQTGQIVEKLGDDIPITGNISTVKKIIDDIFCEMDAMGGGDGARVRLGKFGPKGDHPVKKGDRVILDSGRTVILVNLGKANDAFRLESVPNVRWTDIGGLEEAKTLIREAIEYPHKFKEVYKTYGKKPCKGILLFGPPGTGKTLMAKATATELREIYNGEGAESGFMHIKGPEILDRFVGSSEAQVRQLFSQARQHYEKHKYPAVLFIDEADSILGRRGTAGVSAAGVSYNSFLVPSFLAEMDGLDESHCLIILATNRQDSLDPAIVRDGRIDRKVRVGRPDFDAVKQILMINLKGVPVRGTEREEVACRVAEEVFAESRRLYRLECSGETHYMQLKHTINGAMIAGVVDYAMSLAIRRDIAEERKKGMGITLEDALEAVSRIDAQARDLSQEDNIFEFCEELGIKKDDCEITKARKRKPVLEEEKEAA